MTDEEFEAYRAGRYSGILEFYDLRAIANQKRYHFCSVYVLVVSVAIAPILAIDLLAVNWGKIIAAILSPTVALVNSVATHFKYHDNWLSYRATWDALNRELAFRNAAIGSYENCKDRNAVFVARVEEAITKEGSNWYSRQAKEPSKGDSSPS
jgi:hypothetical protein